METFLLQKYRCDRRKLLQFIISAGLVKDICSPPGAVEFLDVDLDTVSADYVLECAKKGGVLDLSEATKKYYDEFDLPIVINSQPGSLFFLITEPGSSGPPPVRMPPQVGAKFTPNQSSWSENQMETSVEIADSEDDYGVGCTPASISPSEHENDANALSIGLPCLHSGLSDDDLRETAYEVLLASVDISRTPMHSSEELKKGKKSTFLTKLSKREKQIPQAVQAVGPSDLLDIIRVQMEISETMDGCIRKGLMHLSSSTTVVPLITLELLSRICESDFSNQKSYVHWQKRQANVLEELLFDAKDITTGDKQSLKSFFSRIRNTEEWALSTTPSERVEVLMAIKRFALELFHLPVKFGVLGETYFWTDGYHLNVRLYEKLLCCVFDILEEGQLVEETEEILALLQSTWSTLGITCKMHTALYSWVLFRQFFRTGEPTLLDCAILEMQKMPLNSYDDVHEEAYMNSVMCSIEINGVIRNLDLVHAILMSICIWCGNELKDYHLRFSKATDNFGRIVMAAVIVQKLLAGDSGEMKMEGIKSVQEQFEEYVSRSIQAAYKRCLDASDAKSKLEKRHHLAVLAEEIKLIAERESTLFSPVLCRWSPKAGIISAMLLHQLYGERLTPFLEGVSQLSEDVRCVLPAADILDRHLRQLVYLSGGEYTMNSPLRINLQPYQVGEVSGPLIIHWVKAQYDNTLEWIERACHLEDWEPLSSQQKQGVSIVEVFRIIEETVDQFFGLNLPMDLIHLRSLLSGIVQGLEAYLLRIVSQLAPKSLLFPAAPVLTRYKVEPMNPFIKKKSIDAGSLDEEVQKQLNELIVTKLCVRLNTLQFMLNQIDTLEDSIRKCWKLVRPCDSAISMKNHHLGVLKDGPPKCGESVDELFTTFNKTRRTINDAIKKVSEFLGTRVVFWDLRESFIFCLYRGSVGSARLECSLEQFDIILDHICNLITESLRDLVVWDIFKSLMEGYVWVLLDGGPFRVFSESDIGMMQEDLTILKDFFVANGEGLPRAVVEEEARLAQQILNLYALETKTVIELLMAASEQISDGLDGNRHGVELTEDVGTLLRILCHKSDREASKFLKRQYQLPKSSDYDDNPGKESAALKGPLISDFLKRSTSFQDWAGKSPISLGALKKKLQEATYEIKSSRW